jgi:glutathione peroxidase
VEDGPSPRRLDAARPRAAKAEAQRAQLTFRDAAGLSRPPNDRRAADPRAKGYTPPLFGNWRPIMTTVYDFSAKTIDGKEQKLDQYRGKTLLIVNVASRCGYTPQYEGLQSLYEHLHDKGVEVLGFPCDQFGHQEPGTEEQIQEFCSTTYDVTFPMFSKIEVNGEGAHPLYKFLKQGPGGSDPIAWNFTKFLVDKNGNTVKRYVSKDTPEAIEKELPKYL